MVHLFELIFSELVVATELGIIPLIHEIMVRFKFSEIQGIILIGISSLEFFKLDPCKLLLSLLLIDAVIKEGLVLVSDFS